MANARPWAPPNSLYDDRTKAAMADVIAAWSEHWFLADRPRLSDFRAADKDSSLLGAADRHWIHFAPGISVAYPSRGAERLVELALDMDAVSEQARLTDTPILQKFQTTILNDLATRLSAGIVMADLDEAATGAAIVQIRATNDEALCFLRFTRAHLVQFRRSLASAPVRPTLEANLSRCLKDTSVTVQVHLGDASLTLSDARNLCVGDVLLLDATINNGVSLHVANDSDGFAKAAIREQDGRMCLEIMETD